MTVALLLFGAVLLALVLADRAVRRLPLTPALVYLVVGYAAGELLGGLPTDTISDDTSTWVALTEFALLISLFAVGLRLRMPARLKTWHVALLLGFPGVAVAVAIGTLVGVTLLQLPWPFAMVLAAVLAPTDPVLASEVQIRSETDRDAVRLALTAEGGLNDGSAFPLVMLALGLLGLHELGDGGVFHSARWWTLDLAWPIGGGALLGVVLGRLLGHALKARTLHGDTIARDELLYVGAVALAYGLAQVTQTSAFVLVFAAGATLLEPLRAAGDEDDALRDNEQALRQRLRAFGARIERLVEAASVLAVGIALSAVEVDWRAFAFALLLVVVVRPLSVLAVVRHGQLGRGQRRLIAWFGIRGIGSLYYLAYVLDAGVAGSAADQMIAVTLTAIAVSIVLHGVSATPLMASYQRRRGGDDSGPPPGGAAPTPSG